MFKVKTKFNRRIVYLRSLQLLALAHPIVDAVLLCLHLVGPKGVEGLDLALYQPDYFPLCFLFIKLNGFNCISDLKSKVF